MRPLDAFLPAFEFSERHEIAIRAQSKDVDRALRAVTLAEMPAAWALFWLRRFGRPAVAGSHQPFLDVALGRAVLLVDRPGEGVVMGLTGQFWQLRSTPDPSRPRTAKAFLAYDRPDVCKAVIDFRLDELDTGRCRLTTETRVHVEDPTARRAFRRYWLVIRPFSGLIRILLLRAVRRRAEAQAREM